MTDKCPLQEYNCGDPKCEEHHSECGFDGECWHSAKDCLRHETAKREAAEAKVRDLKLEVRRLELVKKQAQEVAVSYEASFWRTKKELETITEQSKARVQDLEELVVYAADRLGYYGYPRAADGVKQRLLGIWRKHGLPQR